MFRFCGAKMEGVPFLRAFFWTKTEGVPFLWGQNGRGSVFGGAKTEGVPFLWGQDGRCSVFVGPKRKVFRFWGPYFGPKRKVFRFCGAKTEGGSVCFGTKQKVFRFCGGAKTEGVPFVLATRKGKTAVSGFQTCKKNVQ